MLGIIETIGLTAAIAIGGGASVETVTVGGMGASLAYLEAAAERFEQETGTPIEVVPGLGGSGANRAVAEGVLDVSISGRGLKEREAAEALVARVLFRTPFGLFTLHEGPVDVAAADVWRLCAEPGAPNAVVDGARVRIVLRPRADSDQAFAKASFPSFEAAYEAARAVPGMPVAQTDQDNADPAEALEHSLTTGAPVQMRGEGRRRRPLAIDGVTPSPAAVADGSYPYAKTFHVVHGPKPGKAALAFVAFLLSEAGVAMAEELGAVVAR